MRLLLLILHAGGKAGEERRTLWLFQKVYTHLLSRVISCQCLCCAGSSPPPSGGIIFNIFPVFGVK